jgi:RNA polymerase-binding protein DksA
VKIRSMTMNKLDLTLIRETLIDEQVMFAADIKNEQDKLQHYVEENPDTFDLADKRLHQEITLNRLGNMEERLIQVTAALKRLDEGLYGICARCGNDIHPERLKAIPYATLCVNCQERLERVR